MKKRPKKVPLGLARLRKEIPPPARIFKSKKQERRKRTKEELSQELKESLLHRSS